MRTEQTGVSAPRPTVNNLTVRGWSPRRLRGQPWEYAVTVVALVSAVAAFWITVNAKFLAYPYWLAVQKADLILGPVLVGLYWRRRRPHSRFGLLLIALGLISIPYVLESTTNRVLFGIGSIWEVAISVMTTVVILAFPSGRIEGLASKLIIAAVGVGIVLLGIVDLLVSPKYGPGYPISGCRFACPANGLAVWPSVSLGNDLNEAQGWFLIAVPIATAGVLIWRFITGTPPRRRTLAIGTPIALLFLATFATYRTIFLLSPDFSTAEQPVHSFLQWTLAAGRSFLWYGFLFALIAAELFAGRTLSRLVNRSLGRPSLRELEGMLRGPLGDPGLRLGFWSAGESDWREADGAMLAPLRSDQRLTQFDLDGRPAVAIVHDAQLSEDPELLQTAGAVALLALENAELDSAWHESLVELADSRARLVRAGDRERHKLERDLHDGAQQRLMALQIRLRIAQDHADIELSEELAGARAEAADAVEELRALAHGLYPPALRDGGIEGALRSMAMSAPIPIGVHGDGIERCDGPLEAALYYCSMEAVQNAVKHAGPDAHVWIRLYGDADRLHLEVRDDGPGFDTAGAHDGIGLQNMRDRIDAVGGALDISSSPGHGTIVRAVVPHGPGSPSEARASHIFERRFVRSEDERAETADTITRSSGPQEPIEIGPTSAIATGGTR
jgi:signal transduction histidine kinase